MASEEKGEDYVTPRPWTEKEIDYLARRIGEVPADPGARRRRGAVASRSRPRRRRDCPTDDPARSCSVAATAQQTIRLAAAASPRLPHQA